MLVCTHCRIALRETETQCPRDGHTGEETVLPELPASLAERFTVVEPFAHGESGTLWLVDDGKSGRRALLKVLRSMEGLRPADRQRIRREWTKQATVDSPHLAHVYESGDADGQLWCLREWVEGVSLAARLSHGPMSPEETLELTGALAAGLDALHRAGLLHRDVKPGHIVVEPQPGDAPTKVTLIDAGCPTPSSGAGGERLWGTPAYLAPEQAAGRLVSFRSDLYSLGCVLYEVLQGEPPFVDDDPLEVIRMHREHDAPAPPAGLPQELEQLLVSLLAKEPQRRPFSAQKVRKTLAPQLPGKPEKAATATFATSAARFGSTPAAGRSVPPPPPSKAPAARATSVPPPVPPSARSKAPSAPPPVPGSTPPQDATQPVDLDQVVAVSAALRSAPPPVPKPSSNPPRDATQPVDLDQIVAVREHFGEAKPEAGGTQPIELDELEAGSEDAQAAAAEPDEAPAQTAEAGTPGDEAASAAGSQTDDEEAQEPPDASPGRESEADLPEERTVPGAHLQVTWPAEEPREAEDLVEPADEEDAPDAPPTGASPASTPPSSPAPTAQPNFVDALAGPDTDEEEDDSPTHVVAVRHLAGAAAAMRGNAPPGAPEAAGSRPSPQASWDDAAVAVGTPSHAQPTGSSAFDVEEPQASGQVETTQVVRNPFAAHFLDPEKRKQLMMVGGGAAALLLLLIWAFSGDDEEQALAAQAATEPSAEKSPETAASAAEQEPEPPSAPAMAEAPSATPVVEPMVEEGQAEEQDAPEQEAQQEPQEDDEVAADPEQSQDAASEQPAPRKARRARTRERKREASRRRRASRSRRSRVDQDAWERARAEARAHYSHRKYARAESAYEQAAAANPRHAGTFAGLGASRLAQGKSRGAVKAYRHAVQLSPGNAAFHAALGHAYAQAGDKRRARASYKKALSLDRRNKAAQAGLAKL